NHRNYFWLIIISLLLLNSNVMAQGKKPMKLISTEFSEGKEIPIKYTCDGEDIAPPLSWTNEPKETKSFVLIMNDPDAPVGNWDRWIVYNIPAETHVLASNTSLPKGTLEGLNSWGKSQYGGPCPPDRRHRYFFKLYALDITLNLP